MFVLMANVRIVVGTNVHLIPNVYRENALQSEQDAVKPSHVQNPKSAETPYVPGVDQYALHSAHTQDFATTQHVRHHALRNANQVPHVYKINVFQCTR